MSFTIEHECPQCGASIEMEETNRILRCPYCDVKSFLFTRDYFRFILPHKAANQDGLYYAPYVRFKGNVFSCMGTTINHRIIDVTYLGTDFSQLPMSLGVRPQAMKIRFVTRDVAGSFLPCSLDVDDVLAHVVKHASRFELRTPLHRAYIGDALSLIYLPIFVEGKMVFDAVLNRPITVLPEGTDVFGSARKDGDPWELTFMATICPQCGWNLEGERDSVVLACHNCQTAWAASKGRFEQVKFMVVPGRGKDAVYVPFWKISAVAEGIEIQSFADFIRITNQPRVVGKEWEREPMSFWSPAFKIRPKVYLHLSRQFTVTQKSFQGEEEIGNRKFYPVTLPHTEAVQAMKTILAASTLHKKDVLPLLPRVNFKILDSTLVFLPFTDNGNELFQEEMRASINKNTLEFGRKL